MDEADDIIVLAGHVMKSKLRAAQALKWLVVEEGLRARGVWVGGWAGVAVRGRVVVSRSRMKAACCGVYEG